MPYHLQKDVTDIDIKGYGGENILVKNRLHDWHKPPTDFNKFDGLFESRGIMVKSNIGKSQVRLINAKAMLDLAIGILTENPLFLLI